MITNRVNYCVKDLISNTYFLCSSNLTVEGSPFKITSEAAEEALEKAPEPMEPQPVEPIGTFFASNVRINTKALYMQTRKKKGLF